ncbi:hypothetical protein [Kibdelosporangium aridum]|uniref:Uncharacterized protein n=1 Tax=Kibdelosporangium aridum TaxID=2030 RepID=A0A1W2BAG4_KIBAR|nr:hypothetical protein [Kibdelosporangium aridum]SMC69896.1 hypothetical protein SAMN05661093_01518 [Kibdelosporangium aridum]
MTPAQEWRATVRQGMSQAPSGDEELHAYLVREFPAASGIGRFVLAVGLLTFGHIEVVADIVAGMPPDRHPARILARAVDALIPTGGDVLSDPRGVAAWVAEHAAELVWNEQTGLFEPK